ncbi:ORF4 [Retroperitoneal fibromatosis-associated herpesvirus]|uniref:ORF4 n=1 Tax=Retroperitoneal fibromatosis-associated herpesvirus TaxID=111469 RepID=U5NIS9_9GAMA|nr:ORF4 [Retroperitoneal fibromatosis-associated herpesvirus]AGY30684.1 ORF4 [Retroperitoneal fibromatosis-associated herpesvirus]
MALHLCIFLTIILETCIAKNDIGMCDQPWFTEYKSKTRTKGPVQVGQTVELTCRLGYFTSSKVSNITTTCQANGSWSIPSVKCEKKSCENPGELTNGNIIFDKGPDALKYGATITYVCNEGYMLLGESMRFCMLGLSGQVSWSSAAPICEKKKCIPPKFPNGTFAPQNEHYEYNDAITFTCNKGLTLIGKHTTSCGSNEWTDPIPTCERTGCKFPHISNGYISMGHSKTFDHGQSVTVKCNVGYFLQGTEMSTCTITEWNPPLADCVSLADQPTPQPPQAGNVTTHGQGHIPEDTSRGPPTPLNPEVQTTPDLNVQTETPGLENKSTVEAIPPTQHTTNAPSTSTDPIEQTPTETTHRKNTTPATEQPTLNSNPPKNITQNPDTTPTQMPTTVTTTHHKATFTASTPQYTTQPHMPFQETTSTDIPLVSTTHPNTGLPTFNTPYNITVKPTTNASFSPTDAPPVTHRPSEPTHPPIFRPPPSNTRALEKHMVIGVLSLVAIACGFITLVHYVFFR